jgi:hypothetical protein
MKYMKKHKTHYDTGKVLSAVKRPFIFLSSVFGLPTYTIISFWVKFLLNNNNLLIVIR